MVSSGSGRFFAGFHLPCASRGALRRRALPSSRLSSHGSPAALRLSIGTLSFADFFISPPRDIDPAVESESFHSPICGTLAPHYEQRYCQLLQCCFFVGITGTRPYRADCPAWM